MDIQVNSCHSYHYGFMKMEELGRACTYPHIESFFSIKKPQLSSFLPSSHIQDHTDKFITPILQYHVNESFVFVVVQQNTTNLSTIQSIGVLIFCSTISKTFNILWYIFAYKLIFKPWICVFMDHPTVTDLC